MKSLFKRFAVVGDVLGGVKRSLIGAGVAAVSAAPLLSNAQTSTSSSVDYTGLTSQVDFSSTVTAVMAVAGTLVVLYVAIKGAKIVLRMIRGA